ncbi:MULTISPECIES: hypothetical protein [unclassified Rathayibacter]|uniref:hypothetical protein n=1 Tax=unclassified Rathayibacter TaxID=2609250 RepID=UPI000F4C1B23|nr:MULTISPECIES: hypothetical protein [unclassified Rathayibacter]ROP56785.1 hypothetical protein EDF45_0306 [Rathayibacter sp. PhB186]ROS55170.1 hypothetical protein EDF44_0306 [Rathayibacter sp. PhB185]
MTSSGGPGDGGSGDGGPDEGGRREELIAAALAGELSAEEAAELDRLRGEDPSVDEELASFGAVLSGLGGVGRWEEPEPSVDLRTRVAALAGPALTAVPRARGEEARGASDPRASVRRGSARPARGRRTALAVTAAAACVALGAVGGLALQALGDRPPEGGPGTLGAVEPIAFAEDPALDIDAELVAHTWGTETILRGSGFAVGESYEVVLVTATGVRLPSGSFLGSTAELDCAMNAAVLRASVASIEITDESGGAVAVAELPVVES